jgi:ribosomal protein S27AE
MKRKAKAATSFELTKLRRKKGLCTRCGAPIVGGGRREVGGDGKFVRGTIICCRCSISDNEARWRAAAAYAQEHPVRLVLSLWGEGLEVAGSVYEPEDLPGPANNNGSHFVCSS